MDSIIVIDVCGSLGPVAGATFLAFLLQLSDRNRSLPEFFATVGKDWSNWSPPCFASRWVRWCLWPLGCNKWWRSGDNLTLRPFGQLFLWIFFWKRNITFLQRSSLNFWVNILCNCARRVLSPSSATWPTSSTGEKSEHIWFILIQWFRSTYNLCHFICGLNWKVEIWALGRKLLLVTNIALCLLNMLDAILSLVSPTWPLCTVSL